MNGSFDFSEPVAVTCPRCQCRFQPAIRQTFYFAKCPDCSEPVRVPAAAELDHIEREPETPRSSGEDTYRLANPPGWEDPPDQIHFAPYSLESQTERKVRPEKKSPPKQQNPAEDTSDTPSEQPGPRIPRASCPACGASFAAAPSDQPQVVLCPECLEEVPIPPMSASPPPLEPAKHREHPASNDEENRPQPESEDSGTIPIAWDTLVEPRKEPAAMWAFEDEPKKKRRKKPRAEVASEPPENPSRREKPSKNVFDTMAEVRQVEEEPPPEWTFFSGVTDFLARPPVAIRWLYASLGVCAMGWLCALVSHYFATFPIALPFFLLPLFWIGMVTLSYLAANSMVILLETAAGNDTVEGWPEPVFKEQAIDLAYVAFLLIVGEVVSFFLGNILDVLIGPGWLVSLVLLYLLYPILLLSALENDSPFVPLSWPILYTLKAVPWAWGVFYALSSALMMVWVLPLVWYFGDSGWKTFFLMIVLAPLISGWCFLYARLLGRLAWRASLEFPEDEEEPASSEENRPKKNRPSESSGELQAAR